MTLDRADDLVFVHNNLRFFQEISHIIIKKKLNRGTLQEMSLDHLIKIRFLKLLNLSLDEPELKIACFNDDDQKERGRT